MFSVKNQGFSRLAGAVFLVAGTCIGGGMLALPVATGVNGLIPSIALMLLCWLMMTATGLLLVEIALQMEPDTHVMTMAARLLGAPARALSWFLFLFVSYASVVAYTAGGGVTTAGFAEGVFGLQLSKGVSCLLFVLLFGSMTCFGARFVGRVNSVLFIAMIGAYFFLVSMGGNEVSWDHLSHTNWKGAHLAIPLLLTAFSFQSFLIPSLARYLDRDARSLRCAVIWGTTTALIVYIIWQWLVLGTVPVDGPYGLQTALMKGEPATEYLRRAVHSPLISYIAEYFAFFALVTSFLGMSLGLYDFLADGLGLQRDAGGTRWGLGALIIIPTLIIAVFFERAFLIAIDASGGYGDTIINGILPVLMVWTLRSSRKEKPAYRVRGGHALLVVLLIFYSAALGIEVVAEFSSTKEHEYLQEPEDYRYILDDSQ